MGYVSEKHNKQTKESTEAPLPDELVTILDRTCQVKQQSELLKLR